MAKPETRPRERDGEPVEVREEAADRRKQTRFNRERAEKNALALQLEKLDRAAGIVQGALELPERSGAPAPGLNHLPWGTADDSGLSGGSGWNGAPESGWSSPTALPGGELDVAQLADRAFRRDSRRYDGGFFLY